MKERLWVVMKPSKLLKMEKSVFEKEVGSHAVGFRRAATAQKNTPRDWRAALQPGDSRNWILSQAARRAAALLCCARRGVSRSAAPSCAAFAAPLLVIDRDLR